VDLYDRGMREPLPLYCRTSAAYASGGDRAARAEWTSEWNYTKEDAEREHVLVLGGVRSFDELLEAAPRSDENGDGWDGSEPYRFGRCARRLWDGLLAVEEISVR
jgi:exodeoxyribonuclease V gamma subunit